ncbi:MAG: hypothetical protein HYT77_02665 [Deltaproteobacteria bacterium]|nr:hypothetical protein [Deltaproteobacteria bacterium]
MINQQLRILLGSLLLCLFVSFSVQAAEPWVKMHHDPAYQLFDLSFGGTAQEIYAVGGAFPTGEPGVILKSSDYGATWVEFDVPSHPSGRPLIRGIDCVGLDTCYASGGRGLFYKTTDRGATWTVNTAPLTRTFTGPLRGTVPSFQDVAAVSDRIIVMVGDSGTIFRSADGGVSWNQVSQFGGSFFKAVKFHGMTGFVVASNGTIRKSTDGGATWEVSFSGGGITADDIEIEGDQVWTAGIPFVLRSSNGGTTWVSTSVIDPVGGRYGIEFVNASDGWVVGGASNYIRKTVNGGATWFGGSGAETEEARVDTSLVQLNESDEEEPFGPRVTLRAVECSSEALCFIVGDEATILRRQVGAPPPAPSDRGILGSDNTGFIDRIWRRLVPKEKIGRTTSPKKGDFSHPEKGGERRFEERDSGSRWGARSEGWVTRRWEATRSCPPEGSLVTWYTAEGNANDAIGVFHGSLEGDVAFETGREGAGESFSFPGDDFIGVNVRNPGPGSPLNPVGDYTIMAWFKRTAETIGSPGIDHEGGAWLFNNRDHVQFTTASGSVMPPSVAPDGTPIPDGTYQMPINDWLHLTGVIEGGTIKLYWNGDLLNSFTNPSPTPGGTGELKIGYGFEGLIDDVMIFNRALTTAQIRNFMRSRSCLP